MVRGFTIGDEVFGSVIPNGAFSEYSILSATQSAHKLKGVSFIDATTLPVATATAYAGVEELHLTVGRCSLSLA